MVVKANKPDRPDRPEVLVEQALNEVLVRVNETADEQREASRETHRLTDRLAELEREAVGLRLAMFALVGQPTDTEEAIKQNAKARAELRRART